MAVSKESSAVRGIATTSVAVTGTRLQARAGSRLRIRRQFTRPGTHPYDDLAWERRGAKIANEKGEIVFEQDDVEVPASWSQMATNVVVSKYFHGGSGTPARETTERSLEGNSW